MFLVIFLTYKCLEFDWTDHFLKKDYSSQSTENHAGLYGSPSDNKRLLQNVNSTVEYWLEQGAAPEKLNLGFAFYGKSYSLFDANQFGIGAPAARAGNPGKVNPLLLALQFKYYVNINKNKL